MSILELREKFQARLREEGFSTGESSHPIPIALELACFGAWLIHSDGFALASEREALELALVEELQLDPAWTRVLLKHVFSCKVDNLPPPGVLLRLIASQTNIEHTRVIRCLLRVAAADGSLHRRELALIERLGYALGLSTEDLKHPFRAWGANEAIHSVQLDLSSLNQLSVGRHEDNDIQLPSLSVSRHHARLYRHQNDWWAEDLGSDTGTLVNGQQIQRHRVSDGDLVQLENFCLQIDLKRQRLTLWDENHLLVLSAHDVRVQVKDTENGGSRHILDGVSCSFYSGQLVAIAGPSGCGKTTFINTLLGKISEVDGSIMLNGRECPGLLPRYASRVGIVPQDDLVHSRLTVEETLFFSGSLRAVVDVTHSEIESEVDRVIQNLGLEGIRKSQIGDPDRRGISGGERKRVNLGQELLNPSTQILILDEPTTGLDPHTGLEIFRLLRQIADQGRIVLVVTHRVDEATLGLLDRMLVLGTGGHRTYFGPPSSALEFFQSTSLPDLFGLIRNQEQSEKWREQFDQVHASMNLVPVEQRLLLAQTEDRAFISEKSDEKVPLTSRVWREAKIWWRQLQLGIRRYERIKRRDIMALVVHLAQVPLIVAVCWLFFQETLTTPTAIDLEGDGKILAAGTTAVPGALPFILVIAAFWLGCVSSVREIVGEQAILRRERATSLRLLPYVTSKLCILGLLAIVQAALLVVTTELMFGLSQRQMNLFMVYGVLAMTALVGVASGLCASALFRTPEAAVATLPLLVIPQLLCGGVLVPLDHEHMEPAVRTFTVAAASRWATEGLVLSGSSNTYFTVPGETIAAQKKFLTLLGLTVVERDKDQLTLGSYEDTLSSLAVLFAIFCGVTGGILSLRRDLR